jgi:phytoene dehydrogenase-like protein
MKRRQRFTSEMFVWVGRLTHHCAPGRRSRVVGRRLLTPADRDNTCPWRYRGSVRPNRDEPLRPRRYLTVAASARPV